MGNKVVIRKKQERINCVIVYIGPYSDFPMSLETSVCLDKLAEMTDVFLVFDKSIEKKVHPNKVASLYRALGYMETEDPQTKAFSYALGYLDNVVEKYSGYFYINYPDISDLTKEDTNAIFNLGNSAIVSSVFSYRRLDPDELGNIYMKTGITEKGILGKLKGLSGDDISGLNTTHISEDGVLFFRPVGITKFLEFLDSDKTHYLDSFKKYSVNELMASWFDCYYKDGILPLEITKALS